MTNIKTKTLVNITHFGGQKRKFFKKALKFNFYDLYLQKIHVNTINHIQHKVLYSGEWEKLPLPKQMANIGSEAHRVIKWLAKGRNDNAERAFERMQELVDLTIAYGRQNASNRNALLKEICRFRELFCAAFLDSNLTELTSLNHYLDHFAQCKA